MSEVCETKICQECGNYMDIIVYDSSCSESELYICPYCDINQGEE